MIEDYEHFYAESERDPHEDNPLRSNVFWGIDLSVAIGAAYLGWRFL